MLSVGGAILSTQVAPVSGFPDGWQLRPGDRVILTGVLDGASPLTIMPLVESVRGRVEQGAGRVARIGGQELKLRPGAVVQRSAVTEESIAFYVANDVDDALSCVSIKPVSAFANP